MYMYIYMYMLRVMYVTSQALQVELRQLYNQGRSFYIQLCTGYAELGILATAVGQSSTPQTRHLDIRCSFVILTT